MSDLDREELGELLSAYLDGEVTAEEADFLERVVAKDEDARQLMEELERAARLVSSLPVHAAPSSIATDLQLKTERSELLGDLDELRPFSGGRSPSMLARLSVAAMLGIAAVGVWAIIADQRARRTPSPEPALVVASKDVERKELAERLGPRIVDAGQAPGRGAGRLQPIREGFEPEGGGPAEALIPTANLDQKLAAQLPLISLRTHRFENEPVHLQIPVQTRADQETVVNRLVAHLGRDQVVDLTDRPVITLDRGVSTSSFYYRGQAGMNFDEAKQRQILVRAPMSKINGLMNELEGVVQAKESVKLVMEPFALHGLDNARMMLQESHKLHMAVVPARERLGAADNLVTPPTVPVETTSYEFDPTAPSPYPTFRDLLEEMFETDLELFDAVSAPVQDAPSEHKPRARVEGDKPLTLVERRLRSLQQPSGTRGRGKKAAVAKGRGPATAPISPPPAVRLAPIEEGQIPATTAEAVVTLVVQVVIAEPEAVGPKPTTPADRPKPVPRPDAKEAPSRPVRQ